MSGPRKPVVVFTVHRRYFELDRALANLRELSCELSNPPDVVVVWACPEVGRLWYFQRLLREGSVQHVLTRLPVESEGQGRPTTYPESLNIRMGLEFVRDHYGHDTYVILHAADVLPRQGRTYTLVDSSMQEGASAVIFYWPCGIVRSDIWHTNFFAVSLDERYWPPVSPPVSDDVLEWQWGKKLKAARLPSIVTDTNVNQYWFSHEHLSEKQPPWPVLSQSGGCHTHLLIAGHQSWWRRWLEWLRLVRPMRRMDG